jgi:hypothetical protein
MHDQIIGLDPTYRPAKAANVRRPAARPASLKGASVGLVINGLGHSPALFAALHRALELHAGVGEAIVVRKPDISSPPRPDDWERLKSADVAITGFGGCGSCSTRSIRDAMELEWAGVPAVALVHEAVRIGVDTMIKLSGMSGYPYILVRAPLTSVCDWSDQQIEQVAADLAPQLVEMLTRRAEAVAA